MYSSFGITTFSN